jgi:hypothetical protein
VWIVKKQLLYRIFGRLASRDDEKPLTGIRVGIISLAVLLFAGCVTPYQADGFRGGYRDLRIDEDTFEISFAVNKFTSREAEYAFFLYRCSIVTTNNGGDYFVIKDFKDFELLRKYDLKHAITGTIKTHQGTKPADPDAFDARGILLENAPANPSYRKIKWHERAD